MGNPFGRSTIVPLTNKSGGSVAAGDFVYIDPANNDAFTTGTTSGYAKGIGIAQATIASNAIGLVLIDGYASLVNVNASVTRGDFLKGHSVVKQGTDAGASRAAGTCGMFLTGGTTPDAIIWQPDLGAGSGEVVSTAAIWDAAGDLAVGSGADTAAKLSLGAVGSVLARVNGAVAWNGGTSFPGSKATGDRFYRSDLDLEFYWDGTRWLTTELFYATVGAIVISATSVGSRFGALLNTGLDLWVVAADLSVGVFGTNNGSNFWTYTIDKRASNDGITVLFTTDTSAVTASTWTRVSTAIGASVAISTAFNFIIQATVKTGAPANLQIAGGFTYRLIGT